MSKIYKGVDISLYQGNPDFNAVRAAGVDFVMHKAGQGRTRDYNKPFTDPRFRENVRACSRIGDDFYSGSYWYFMARNESEVREEAAYYINLLDEFKYNLQLWAAVDVEDDMLSTDPATLSKLVKQFCDAIKRAGYRPMIYANSYWLDSRFTVPAGVPIWEANWSIKSFPSRARMWQATSSARINGIAGNVDYNLATGIIGDADGDGKVNVKDIVKIMRKIAGWNVEINESQADADQDGYVTLKDTIKIIRDVSEGGSK